MPPGAPEAAATAGRFLRLGFAHILPEGLDHVLFVLGLALLSARLGPLLAQVTAFTLAHTLTLALAVYGVVSLPSRVVEPLIAASIVYVAVENLFRREASWLRLALVFAFGLLHGLGFAGVLVGARLAGGTEAPRPRLLQPGRGAGAARGDRPRPPVPRRGDASGRAAASAGAGTVRGHRRRRSGLDGAAADGPDPAAAQARRRRAAHLADRWPGRPRPTAARAAALPAVFSTAPVVASVFFTLRRATARLIFRRTPSAAIPAVVATAAAARPVVFAIRLPAFFIFCVLVAMWSPSFDYHVL